MSYQIFIDATIPFGLFVSVFSCQKIWWFMSFIIKKTYVQIFKLKQTNNHEQFVGIWTKY